MSMNDLISQHFAPAATVDFEKQAQLELFAKLADSNGINLDQLSQEQISYLWDQTFNKTASEEEDKEKNEKVEAAEKEHEGKKEAAAKVAEAQYLGEVMAHSMTATLDKIAAERGTASPAGFNKLADEEKSRLKRGLEAVKGKATAAGKAVGTHLGNVGAHTARHVGKAHEGAGNALFRHAKTTGAAVYGAGAAAAAGAAVGAKKLHDRKEKKSSALDELSGEQAVIKASEAGWDPEEAGQLIGALLTLGVNDSEKIASAADLETAVEIRSLELLELAGYPVTWPG